ncbi:hypothetical protein [Actinoplanes sp. TFC3]|uniref:hypothetical protein n=1 Tax=Actinoplanes sp. TFC3 TaxID=1710355 RepID=UPI000831C92B|nr:hypothetical protein [Actinoplanes sp. TFC3]
MTFIHVDIHQHTHTCPADPQPHPYDTRQTIITVVHGGPCRAPITLHSGDTSVTVDCRRRLRNELQCPACRTTVIEHAITQTYHGHIGPQLPCTWTAA